MACTHCGKIMYPGETGCSENHGRGYCSDGVKVSLQRSPQSNDSATAPGSSGLSTIPEWPQPQGIFTAGKTFSCHKFKEHLQEIYQQIVINSEDTLNVAPNLEHEVFIKLIQCCIIIVGNASLFKLLEGYTLIDKTLIVEEGGLKYI